MPAMQPALRRFPSISTFALRTLAVAGLLLCIPHGRSRAAGQQSVLLPDPPSKPQAVPEVNTKDATPTFSSRVNLVPVTVVVRDEKGRAIGTLTKDDFSLTDNGKPQVITKFSVEKSDTPVILQKETPDLEAPVAPAPAVAPVIATRFVLYLFDDIHLKFEDLVHVRDAAARQVTTALRPEDRVAVYTTSGRDIMEFTDDRAALQGALARLRPNPITGGTANKCPDISYYMADRIVNLNDGQALQVALMNYQACSQNPYVTAQEVQTFAQSALSEGVQETRITTHALQELVRRLSAMPGQRIMVLTSPGFFATAFEHSDVAAIINKAIAAKVIINSLDARGVWVPPGYEASRPTPLGGAQVITAMNSYLQDEAQIQGEVLGELADGTGGTWIHDNNDLNGAFHRLATPPEYLYVLTFSPDSLKSDGKYHKIKVTLRDPKGLTLQARKGYYAPRREADPAKLDRQELEDAVFTRDVLQEIPIELHTQFFKPTDDTARLSVMARLDLKGFQFHKAEDRNLDNLVLVAAVFDTNGNYVAGTQKDIELKLKDDTLAGFAKPGSNGLTIRTTFDVRPGNYVVRLVVRDSGSHQMAEANGAVEIP